MLLIKGPYLDDCTNRQLIEKERRNLSQANGLRRHDELDVDCLSGRGEKGEGEYRS
jgi:hypothetical protein